MSSPQRPIILASASPRRADILSQLGIAFEVEPSDADESSIRIDDDDVELVRETARLKARAVLARDRAEAPFVLAADTAVCVSETRLGKPSSTEDACAMLKQLAGRDHVVMTAIALGRAGKGMLATEVVQTRVWFRNASEEEIARYVASGESWDKAGAYAVQGLASGFVTRIEGSYTNVVGLPAAETIALLLDHGALGRWP